MIYAKEIEDVVIGQLLLSSKAQHEVLPHMTDECFYNETNRTIFQAMQKLYAQDKAIDLTIIFEFLKGEVTASQLTEYTYRVGTTENVNHHALILTEKYLRRKMIEISERYSSRAQDEAYDVLELLNSYQEDVMKLGNVSATRQIYTAQMIGKQVVDSAEGAKDSPDSLLGISTGFMDVDRVTNGWKSPDLVIIAGRPAMGKTSFAVQCALNAKVPVGIFSLEMSKEQIVRKMFAMYSGITTHDIECGRFDQRLYEAKALVDQLDIFINDRPALTSLEIRAIARTMVKQHGCKMIVIDYLQLISGGHKGRSRENEVSEISRNLKAMAKELEIPVIALSQLSRKCEDRSDKRPMLSDLRESGAIEQDADMVVFLYRPEYYGEDVDAEGETTEGLAEIIISKHRNGEIGSVRLTFESQFTRFTNREYDLVF